MKAVHSLWTGTTGFTLPRALAMLFSMSSAYLNDWFPDTELVTDMRGLEIAQRLGWQYKSCVLALEKFCPKGLEHVWCLGKYRAHEIQTEPHFHSDLDLVLMSRFKARIEGARVAAQSIDPPGFYQGKTQQAMLHMAGIPDYTVAHNTGILLFNDLDLCQKYISLARKALYTVGRKVSNGTQVCVCIEQAAFSYCMKMLGARVEEICILPIPGMMELPGDMSTPFAHFWGRSKKDAAWLTKAEAIFSRSFPEAYSRFNRGWPVLQKANRIPTGKSIFVSNEDGPYSYLAPYCGNA